MALRKFNLNIYIHLTVAQCISYLYGAAAYDSSDNFNVSDSTSVANNTKLIWHCNQGFCNIHEASYTLGRNDCGIIYEEPNCETCYTVLSNYSTFLTKTSNQIKGIIVRTGCHIETSIHGYMGEEYFPGGSNLTGIITYMNPSYHVSYNNFTCHCSHEHYRVVKEHDRDEYESMSGKVYRGIGIGVHIVCCVAAALAVRKLRSSFSNRRNQSGSYLIPGNHDSLGLSMPTNSKANLSSQELKTEILEEVEQRIGIFLNRAFNHTSNSSFDQHNSICNSFHVHVDELYKISNTHKILSRSAFSIDIQNPLGSGHFSTVYKGVLTKNGVMEPVAVKKLKREDGRENWIFKSFLHEVKTFETVDNGSEFIVKYFGACCQTDGLYLLTEFCESGSLRQFLVNMIRPKYEGRPMGIENLRDLGNNYFTEEKQDIVIHKLDPTDYLQLVTWCEHITSGMEFLYNNRIVHGDLAVRNVLLSHYLLAKICDFGLSRKCTNKEYYETSIIKGDFPFNSLAPECLCNDGTDLQKLPLSIDVWAFGCTLWELFTLGDMLYSDVEAQGILKFVAVRERLVNGVPQLKPTLANDMIYEHMLECWSKIPGNRPSFETLRKNFQRCVSEFQL